jgi:uncharacterized protein GlcG (DUF336 family)
VAGEGTVERVISRPSISLAAAKALIEAAEAASRREGVANNITVVNVDGVLKGFHSMDGAASLTVAISQNKAYTAASFGLPTQDLADALVSNAGILASVGNIPHFALIGGGVPIRHGDTVVGGLGVSGSGTPAQDVAVAQAAIAEAWSA